MTYMHLTRTRLSVRGAFGVQRVGSTDAAVHLDEQIGTDQVQIKMVEGRTSDHHRAQSS